jgi:predicted TPR repeat methyltransferase/Flp pilus assembly protein TadD
MNEDHAQKAVEWNHIGNAHFSAGKWDEAVHAYQKAITHQPSFPHAHYNLGLVYNKLAKKNEAKSVFQNLIDLVPEHDPARFQLAALFMQEEDYFIALSHYLFILDRAPSHAETVANAATCYLQLGKLAEANTYYLQALDFMPEDKQILFNLGVIAMQQGRLKEAITYYLQIINQFNKNDQENTFHFSAHNNIGVIYLALCDKENALLHFRAAAEIYSNNNSNNNESILHTIDIIENKKNIDVTPIEYVRTLFNSYANHYDVHLTSTLGYAVPQCIHDVLISKIKLLPKQKVIDLGCGTGLTAELLLPYEVSLTGVDVSEAMLKAASEKKIYDELINNDLLTFLQSYSWQYDGIIMADVLPYFGELQSIFSLITNIMKKSSWLIFTVEKGYKQDYEMLPSGRFIHCNKYIVQLLQEAQLKIIKQQAVILRTQDTQPVAGEIYLAKLCY